MLFITRYQVAVIFFYFHCHLIKRHIFRVRQFIIGCVRCYLQAKVGKYI